jgi:hypothetical protein
MLLRFRIPSQQATLSQEPPNRLTGGHFAIVTDVGIVIATAAGFHSAVAITADAILSVTITGAVTGVEIGTEAAAAMMAGVATTVEATATASETTVSAVLFLIPSVGRENRPALLYSSC